MAHLDPRSLDSILAEHFLKEASLTQLSKRKSNILFWASLISAFLLPLLMAFLLIGLLMARPYIWRPSFKVEVSNSCLREGSKTVCACVCASSFFYFVITERRQEWRKEETKEEKGREFLIYWAQESSGKTKRKCNWSTVSKTLGMKVKAVL